MTKIREKPVEGTCIDPEQEREAATARVEQIDRGELPLTETENVAWWWVMKLDEDRSFSIETFGKLASWLRASDNNCWEFLRVLHSFRRQLILRRSALPLLYGHGKGNDERAVEELRLQRWEHVAEVFTTPNIPQPFEEIIGELKNKLKPQ